MCSLSQTSIYLDRCNLKYHSPWSTQITSVLFPCVSFSKFKNYRLICMPKSSLNFIFWNVRYAKRRYYEAWRFFFLFSSLFNFSIKENNFNPITTRYSFCWWNEQGMKEQKKWQTENYNFFFPVQVARPLYKWRNKKKKNQNLREFHMQRVDVTNKKNGIGSLSRALFTFYKTKTVLNQHSSAPQRKFVIMNSNNESNYVTHFDFHTWNWFAWRNKSIDLHRRCESEKKYQNANCAEWCRCRAFYHLKLIVFVMVFLLLPASLLLQHFAFQNGI